MECKSDDSEKGSYKKLDLMDVNGFDSKPPDYKEISAFRRILPQVFASAAQNLLILDLAMAMNFPTIAIPPLRGIRNREDDEVITFTEVHSSWFASMAFICQPIGSILSGVIVEKLGRKHAMMVVNIPHIVAWIMLYFAQDIYTVFIANLLLGLGVGFMEAPGISFCTNVGIISVPWIMVSEIYPNKTRGMASGITAAINYLMFFISTKTYYDLETSVSLFGVITIYGAVGFIGTIFVYFFLPETEGRTLEEIEEHFSNNRLKLTDRKIASQRLLDKR
uniref:CSON014627 protein n=1 Tax=Culicoides sonorensis TaxID=179676 RepID=A0A336M0F0_CULSO